MKQLIRRWLGIPDPVQVDEAEFNRKLRRMVGEAFKEILAGFGDASHAALASSCVYFNETVPRTVAELAARQWMLKEFGPMIEQKVAQRLRGEEFIDEIVARLNRKQLGLSVTQA